MTYNKCLSLIYAHVINVYMMHSFKCQRKKLVYWNIHGTYLEHCFRSICRWPSSEICPFWYSVALGETSLLRLYTLSSLIRLRKSSLRLLLCWHTEKKQQSFFPLHSMCYLVLPLNVPQIPFQLCVSESENALSLPDYSSRIVQVRSDW